MREKKIRDVVPSFQTRRGPRRNQSYSRKINQVKYRKRVTPKRCDAARDNRFPIFSTSRQFKRYLNYWRRDDWVELALAAVAKLADGT
jgi:hypothetical protein